MEVQRNITGYSLLFYRTEGMENLRDLDKVRLDRFHFVD